MKNKGKYLVLIGIVTVALVVVWWGFRSAKANGGKAGLPSGRPGTGFDNNDHPVSVTTVQVKRVTMQNSIILNGTVKPVQEAEISARVSGKVTQIYFELGQQVKKGDVLFKLDDHDLRLELQQTEAALKVIQTSLSSSLVTAETNYLDAKRQYERLKRLYDKQIGSKQELELAESAYKVAEENYKSAKLAEQSGTTNAKAQLEKARLAYDVAKTQLDYTVVRAPISGTIATKDIKIGQYVSSSTTVATIVDLSSLLVETDVPEDKINQLHVGDQVEVSVKAVSNQPLAGKISAIAPAVNNTTLNYPVKVRVPNQQNRLKSGMFATVKFNLNQAEQVLAIPIASLGEEDGRKFVYTINKGIAAKKFIKTGISDSKMVQVTAGLSEEDQVVVKGVNQLKAGSKVRNVK
ncbi:MAG TPA: efflux RND transporter periplasmic adaptor subunit [Bacillota bacterium]